MKFSDAQQIRICEIAETIYWQAVSDSGGLFVEDANDLEVINTKVYEQGKKLLRYLEDISIEDPHAIKMESPPVKIIKKGNK